MRPEGKTMSVLTDLSVEAMAAGNEANLYVSSPASYVLANAEAHVGDDVYWCSKLQRWESLFT
jgi:hypothetical protein